MGLLKHLIPDDTIRHLALCAAIALSEAIQCVIIVVLIFSYIPFGTSDFVKTIFPLYVHDVKPEREILFFHTFIASACLIQILLVMMNRAHINDAARINKLKAYLGMSVGVVLLQLFMAFKVIMYKKPDWAYTSLLIVVGLSVALRFFWIELDKAREWLKANYAPWLSNITVKIVWDLMSVGMIGIVLYVSNPQYILARIMVSGNIDLFTQAIHTFPFGALTVENSLRILMIGLIAYVAGVYIFLRAWLHNRLLAAALVILMMKWQFFHWGSFPIFWQFPQYINGWLIVDIVSFALIYAASQYHQRLYLYIGWLGIIGHGIALVLMHAALDTTPLYAALRGRNFFIFCQQFFLPVFLMFTLLLRRKDQVVCAACALGLVGMVVQADNNATSNYYWVCALPLTIVIGYWMKDLMIRFSQGMRMTISTVILFIAGLFLLTNNLMMVYPNALFQSSLPWDKMVAYYQARAVKGGQ